jgi:acetyl-CoA/propionyl-CoA carboxylase biotin carboxyl carrier protein
VEEKLDLSGVEAPKAPASAPSADGVAPLVERSTTVEVDGRRFAVTMWVPEAAPVLATAAATPARKPTRAASGGGAAAIGNGEVAVPMQGTIVKVLVEVGSKVEAGQPVVILEAMKMENQIQAEISGTVTKVKVAPGDTVGSGDIVVVIDA